MYYPRWMLVCIWGGAYVFRHFDKVSALTSTEGWLIACLFVCLFLCLLFILNNSLIKTMFQKMFTFLCLGGKAGKSVSASSAASAVVGEDISSAALNNLLLTK